jgi:glycosyltransferase involved in cell wall biosynthesis
VLDPGEALFLDGRDELTLHEEGGRSVAVVRVDSEDVHRRIVKSVQAGRVSFPVMQPVRATILTSIMAPHRIALFNSLAAAPDVDLTVVYLARSDPSRNWDIHEGEMRYRHRILREHLRMRRGESYVHITSGLVSALREAKPDVLVGGGWDQIAYHEARALRRALGARFLWWVESNLRDRRSERPAFRRLKRRLVSTGDGVVVPGQASAAYVRALGARDDRVWVAPNAVDNDFYRARMADRQGRQGPVRFLFVGRIESGKGLAYLLDAWSRVPGDVELAVAGVGALEAPVRARVMHADIPPVRLLGHLDRESLAAAYSDGDVFVFPSVSDPWGLVLNEAMAAGLPVIVSSAPGAVDDLVEDGNNGFVVPPMDPGPLTEAMSTLVLDPARRLAMGERSSFLIRDFEPERWADGMRQAILEAAATRAAR